MESVGIYRVLRECENLNIQQANENEESAKEMENEVSKRKVEKVQLKRSAFGKF